MRMNTGLGWLAWAMCTICAAGCALCPTVMSAADAGRTACRDGSGSRVVVAPYQEAADVETMPSAEAEMVRISIQIEGREFADNACIPALVRLRAAEGGGWRAWVRHLRRRGVPAERILAAISPTMWRGLSARLEGVETRPVDACIRVGARAPWVSPHRDGRMVDRWALVDAVVDCLEGRMPPPLWTETCVPAVTTQEAKAITRPMATFSTAYAAQPNRVHNMQLACRAINGTVLAVGATFAFNETVGARTAERGYLPAKVIADGSFVEGLGGGVCQVSTTLYNAAMLAGMTQVEVRQHSLGVHYVAPSRDAMVSDWSDMRFRNDTPAKVYVFAEAEEGRVTVRLYGLPQGAISLRADSRVVEPYRNVDAEGNAIGDTQGYHLVSPGRDGVDSTLERTMDGRHQTLRRNSYPRQDAVWAKDPAPANEQERACPSTEG